MESAQVWARCRAGDAASRDALIERYLPLARNVARRAPMTSALADADDMTSAATLGLIDAIDRFEPGRGVPFEGYAVLRIRGAVIDELRRLDERGRSEEPEFKRTLSLDGLSEDDWIGALATVDSSVDDRFEHEDLCGRVQVALETLPPRQRELLGRYYADSLTLREAGVRMGISEARACQLHGRAIVNLRRALSVRLPSVAVTATAA
ncbi:MAG TPA: sigma-70 family RNA polymerase sigma factor [Candidatus Limnocylindria bacterium]|nr:sigma-70 family RNA polymerase sigma factor [Candidatus Limnocylindria bacterium]